MKNAGEIFRLFSKRKWRDRGRRFLIIILLPLFVFQATSLNFLALEMMSAKAAEGEVSETQMTEEVNAESEQGAELETKADGVVVTEIKVEEATAENSEVADGVVAEEFTNSIESVTETVEEVSEADTKVSAEQPAVEEVEFLARASRFVEERY